MSNLPSCYCVRNTFIDDAPEEREPFLHRSHSVAVDFQFRDHTETTAQGRIASHRSAESMQFLLDISAIRLNTLRLQVATDLERPRRDVRSKLPSCYCVRNTFIDDAPEEREPSLHRSHSVPAGFEFRDHIVTTAQGRMASHRSAESMQFLLDTSAIRLETLRLQVDLLRSNISQHRATLDGYYDIAGSFLQMQNAMRLLHEELTFVMPLQLPRAVDMCRCGLQILSRYFGLDITFLKHKLPVAKTKTNLRRLLDLLRSRLVQLPIALIIISQNFHQAVYIDQQFQKHSVKPIDIYMLTSQTNHRIQIFIAHRVDGGGPYLVPCILHPLAVEPEHGLPYHRVCKEFHYNADSWVTLYRRGPQKFARRFWQSQRIFVQRW